MLFPNIIRKDIQENSKYFYLARRQAQKELALIITGTY
jgi:hypothetical protein